MKKWAFLLFFSIILCNSVYSLDCQYKDNNQYEEYRNLFYENNSKLDYDALEIRDIIQGSTGFFSSNPMSFKVYNRYTLDINVTVKYLFYGALHSFDCPIISPNGYCTVSDTSTPGLDSSSIYFVVNSPPFLEAKKELTSIDNYTCKICGNYTCLNDGEACNDSLQCGGEHCVRGNCSKTDKCYKNNCNCPQNELQCPDNTRCVIVNSKNLGETPICRIEECSTGYKNVFGVCALKNGLPCSIDDDCAFGDCNPARICGDWNGSCLNGEQICNNSCLLPSIKNDGQPYSCNWECVNGTMPCEGICRNVSSKKAGQEYFCIQECKTGRGKEGVCKPSIKQMTYFWVFVFIIFLISLLYFGKYKLWTTIEERKGEEKKRDEAKKEKESLNNEIKENSEEINNLKKMKERLKKNFSDKQKEFDIHLEKLKEKENLEIKKLEDKKKKANKEAEIRINKEIEKRKDEYQDRIRDLENAFLIDEDKFHRLIIEKNIEIEELKKRKDEADSLKQINDEIEREQKRNEELAIKNYCGEGRAHINNDGYIVWNNSDKAYHRKLYLEKFPDTPKKNEIHHIDGNKLNNEMWNLIDLEWAVHKNKVRELKIKNEGWKFGLKHLIDVGAVKKEGLHKYILKKLEDEKIDI